MPKNIFKIDATGKSLGRIAAEVASILRGKNSTEFLPNKISDNRVVVFNALKMRITGKKIKDKKYIRYSGYPGGVKIISLEEVLKKDPNKPLRTAVYGMLPKNKLRDKLIKNLKLYGGEQKN